MIDCGVQENKFSRPKALLHFAWDDKIVRDWSGDLKVWVTPLDGVYALCSFGGREGVRESGRREEKGGCGLGRDIYRFALLGGFTVLFILSECDVKRLL